MRLTQKEIETIKSTILNLFGEVKIYIFGSRLDDEAKGGDIDIFIIPKESIENQRIKKAKAIFLLEERLLKPIDIIIHKDFSRLIEKEALKGVEI
jgi:predicted nucleotidyltransferase